MIDWYIYGGSRKPHLLEKAIDDKIREKTFRTKDWAKWPWGELAQCNGMYMTAKDYLWGPTQYLIAQAFAEAWDEFPQANLTAAYVRANILTKEAAAILLKTSAEQVIEQVADLETAQRSIKKSNRWKHPEQKPLRGAFWRPLFNHLPTF